MTMTEDCNGISTQPKPNQTKPNQPRSCLSDLKSWHQISIARRLSFSFPVLTWHVNGHGIQALSCPVPSRYVHVPRSYLHSMEERNKNLSVALAELARAHLLGKWAAQCSCKKIIQPPSSTGRGWDFLSRICADNPGQTFVQEGLVDLDYGLKDEKWASSWTIWSARAKIKDFDFLEAICRPPELCFVKNLSRISAFLTGRMVNQ